ncbi:hybrid sensor histidine kinase/response regulator transcription factor [Pedobacter arcticus]|uniref:hybrid sensor histidine kinase/response regulator transcription factor n=2 Tax=Pedobacter arcticus TaxID=752140 RepID=UPI00058B5454|nr:two-component regulator propeller domain-containing protein [Pedobacter arcticus]
MLILKKLLNKVIVLQLVMLLAITAFADNGIDKKLAEKYFRTISVDRGLSQSTVYSIIQDSLGFMWVATQDGLNRYDGEAFKVYRPNRNDPQSLQSSFIRSLLIDNVGVLWVGGDKGISSYDSKTEKFKNYHLPIRTGEWYVTTIIKDKTGKMWLGTSTGEIYSYNSKSDTFQVHNYNNTQAKISNISQLFFHNNSIYIATDVGVYRMALGAKTIQFINFKERKTKINQILFNDDDMLAASEGAGLYVFNTKNGNLQKYQHSVGNKSSLADNDVRSLAKDNNGNIWIGTFRGLSVFNLSTKTFENHYHQSTIPYTISQNSVRYIYRDRQNGMWLGTYYGGLNYYHQNDIKFRLLNQNMGPLSLNDEVINVIKEDPQLNIWIGTNDKGINFWDRKRNVISYITAKEGDSNSLSSNNVKSIAFDATGNVLIGTHNMGLNYLDRKTNRITRYKNNPENSSSISGDMVYALLTDSKNRIWVGTRSGLNRFNPSEKTFTRFYLDKTGQRLTSDEITYLKEDSKGRIWIGTTKGVNIFYPDRLELEIYKGEMLSHDVVSCITEDKKGRIWVGTRDGLNLYNENKRNFAKLNGPNKLVQGVIYGVQPDDGGNLWISTNTGLIKFDPDSKKVQLFDNKDGLQNSQFNLNAFCKTSDGMILFGGINGITYFYPKSIVQQPFSLKVTFTGLEVLNKPVVVGDSYDILQQQIDHQETIKLSADYKQFTVFFNTFNYISPNKIKYHYKLTGFDNDWQPSKNKNSATFSNLRFGSYTLHIKAVGPLGETSPERTLQIEILPPWWRSNWFYLIMACFIIGGVYVAYKIIAERIRTKQELKIAHLEREKVDYINKVKMEFFTNISHEFRTPLTLIIAPLEELIQKAPLEKSLKRYHELILVNAKRLYHLVDQLFEFRKAELGTKKLQVKNGDIVSFLRDIHSSFSALAERNLINFKFETTINELWFSFDADALEKIAFNLLSNAFKYTKKEGNISMQLSLNGDKIIIKVSDDGVGISPNDQMQIFERFYQVNNNEMNLGSGVGLAFTKRLVELHHGEIKVDSQLGNGSSFIVSLPISDSYYVLDEHLQHEFIDHTIAIDDDSPTDDLQTVEPETINDETNFTGTDTEKLLIVDDNHEIVAYLKNYFSKTYNTSVAHNGLEALELLEKENFDLIISDVMMPEMDGIQFCKKIKQNISTCHIPVILLTAKNETTHHIKGLEVGADDYVTKPFSISILEAKLQNIVRSRRRLKEFYSSSTEIVPENIAFNSLDEDFLRNAIAIMEKNVTDAEFSVDKFSKEIGMSRSNLYLKLKAITGESATDFIKRIRFKKAIELLQTKKYTVAQVAYMSGFNSPSYFSTSFKQYYNCMPTEYIARKELE